MQRNRSKQKSVSKSSLSHTVSKKNEREIITAYSLSTDGKAIAKGEDQIVVFVKDLLPGEKAKVEIIKKKSTYKLALVTKLESTVSYRTIPPCQYYDLCGGCQLQHISSEFQSNFKLQWFFETLKRIGKWNDSHFLKAEQILEVVYLKKEYYRRRIRLHFDGKNLGFKQSSSNKVTNISNCLITTELINNKIEFIKKALLKCVSLLENKHWECEIEITESDDEKIIIHVADVFNFDKNLQISNIIKVIEKNLEINQDQHILIKHPDLQKFKLKKQSFIQPHINCIFHYYKYIKFSIDLFLKKYQFRIQNFITYDLYSGAGVFTGIPYFAGLQYNLKINCYGIEGIKEAIESLNQNYKNLPVQGKTQNVDDFIQEQFENKTKDPNNYHGIHILILDPPRSGCTITNMQKIVEICAKNALILYLACDPASFARDSRVLLEGGFQLTNLTLFDSFGHTTHYEVLGCFEKNE
ncbi:class I SAM-dependent RNA methyltransferase [Pigmentibacter ruber]